MGFEGQFAGQQSEAAHVRFGSKADIGACPRDVRFTPKSRHWNSVSKCPLCAKSRHTDMLPSCGKTSRSDHLVGAEDKRLRKGDTESFCRLEI
jgi:hypothetical protein